MTKSNNKDYLNKLRESAHLFLKDAEFDETKLYQIELEMQNQDMLVIQKEYEKSFDRYLNLFEMAPIPYIIISQSGLINEINTTGANLLGFEKKHLLNRNFTRYISSESQILFSVFKKHCYKDDKMQTCEIKLQSQHGSEHVVQLSGKKQLCQSSNDTELLIIATPLHERSQANWNIFYNQKSAPKEAKHSITDLVAMIAHELNHPLAVILNYVQGCVRRIENGVYKIEEIVSALKIAASQSTRAADIILRMKEFKSYGSMRYEKVILDDLIKSTIEILKNEIMDFPETIELRLAPLPPVNIDKTYIEQVLSNLIRNAIDAMRDNNTAWHKLIIETNRVNKAEVELKVLDNGPGISPQIIRHIFIPHFTTKSYGLGLGLAVSKSIVEAHKGLLTAESNPVGGACFRFNIPIN